MHSDAGAASASCRHQHMANLHKSILPLPVVDGTFPWHGRGLSGTRLKKWGPPRNARRLDPCPALTSLCASISRSASAFGYRQASCGNTPFSHLPPADPSMPMTLKMAFSRPERASVPIPVLWSKVFPSAARSTLGPREPFQDPKSRALSSPALVLASIETIRLPP